MDSQATLLEALQALYHHPDSQIRTAANHWLENFQQTVEAWQAVLQVTDTLLHDPGSNLEVLYFCAQTLRTKVQRDFDDLPPSAVMSLRDSLMTLLKRFRQGPPAVRTQLCLAMAALAVHVPLEEWGNGGVLKWLRNELNSEPEVIPGLLELLTVLPQEAYSYKIAVRPERRRQFQKELMVSVQDAFDMLTTYLSDNATDLLEQVLRALAAWLRLSYGMSASLLAAHPLVSAALFSLDSEPTFYAAVDAVAELIRFTVNGSPGGLAAQMPLVQVVVPRVMALRPRFAASLKVALAEKQGRQGAGVNSVDLEGEEEDDETLKGIAHLLTEMAESYVELIANGSGEAMMIVEALAEVTSHPDDTISEVTFNFWHRLSRVLTKREYYQSLENEAVIDSERERRLAIFRPTFELLVSLVSSRVTYPPGFESWRKDELADFKQTRYAVADMLMDAAAVLTGESTLQLLSQSLIQNVGMHGNEGLWDWRAVEASLYCIRAIAKAVPISENNIMPRVMVIISQFPVQPQLLYTASLTVGAFADWLAVAPSAPTLLPSLLQLLTKGLSVSEDPAAAAALALKHVCDACRNILESSLGALIGVYTEAMSGNGNFHLLAEDELQLVEGLSMVVSALPVEQMPQALEALCTPVVSPLQQLVAEAHQSGCSQKFNPSQYTVPIDRIANLFRYVSQPQPLADVFKRLWPILRMVFIQRGGDMRTMERLCRLCKYAVRTCGRALGDTISGLLEEVQDRFRNHQHSCFMYLASEVIKVFSSDQSCASYLGNLIVVLFGQAIILLRSIEDFTTRPDIADDCFLLASRCIRYCPHLLVPTPVFPSLFDCAMTGITIQHREACRSILTFFQDIFHFSISLSGKQYRVTIDSILLPRGATLSRILIAALVGALPESRVEEVTDVLLSLAQLYGGQVVQWAQGALSLIPPSVATDEERAAFLQAITSAASGADSPVFSSSMEELSDVCRRNKKVLKIVQSALQPHRLTLTQA